MIYQRNEVNIKKYIQFINKIINHNNNLLIEIRPKIVKVNQEKAN